MNIYIVNDGFHMTRSTSNQIILLCNVLINRCLGPIATNLVEWYPILNFFHLELEMVQQLEKLSPSARPMYVIPAIIVDD